MTRTVEPDPAAPDAPDDSMTPAIVVDDPADVGTVAPDTVRTHPSVSAPSTVRAICPYLISADGGWRSGSPAREHRCAAVAPPAALASEKQRRLCLTSEHTTCATYGAALATHDTGDGQRGLVVRRPYLRTTPVVLDRGRLAVTMPAVASGRGAGQLVLIALLAVTFVALVATRFSGDGALGPIAGATATPTMPAVATGAPPPTTVAPTTDPTPVATPDEATPSPTAEVTPTPEPAPTEPPATPEPATYRVKSGDTLSGIASRFGTTVRILAELNGISDPARLRVGQVLRLP
jgi:LysM repeat protein